MTKKERKNRLFEIEKLYTTTNISLQELAEQFEMSYNYISNYLQSKNI